ncbi:hypothetical protein FOA52_001169 [Chlamydomonas sp. UWO 241]|nr:hypothetical protein FOA52_001169 [Chlamydomonas sp. UWO 241]
MPESQSPGGGDSSEEAEAEVGAAVQEDDDQELFPTLMMELPPATHTKVTSCKYLTSCVEHTACPPPRFPEFAVIGRSNVGKSSLINMITNSKRLAHVSKEPGKTRCINHFLINDMWYLVDLPGYGFARVGQEQRSTFDTFTKDYFTSRKNLVMVFQLVDSTVPPQKVDLEYSSWLTDNGVPFAIVFTKTDKRKKGISRSMSAKESNMVSFKRELLKDFEYLPPSIATSAENGSGKREMLHFIGGLRAAYENAAQAKKGAQAKGR